MLVNSCPQTLLREILIQFTRKQRAQWWESEFISRQRPTVCFKFLSPFSPCDLGVCKRKGELADSLRSCSHSLRMRIFISLLSSKKTSSQIQEGVIDAKSHWDLITILSRTMSLKHWAQLQFIYQSILLTNDIIGKQIPFEYQIEISQTANLSLPVNERKNASHRLAF